MYVSTIKCVHYNNIYVYNKVQNEEVKDNEKKQRGSKRTNMGVTTRP